MADYEIAPYRWAPSNGEVVVTWSFATTNFGTETFAFDGALTGQFQTEVRLAFARWEQVSGIDFVEVTDGANNELRLGFDFIDGIGGVVGEAWNTYNPVTGYSIYSEIRFEMNESYTFSGGRVVTQGGSLFYAIALHEIGHTFGLDHYTGGPAIMNPVISISDLTLSDIHGAQALYGPAEPAGPILIVGTAPAFGTAASDTIYGDAAGNTIYALGGDDVIDSDAGADIVDGGLGNDTIIGDVGNDRLEGGAGDDNLNGGAGWDALFGGIGFDYADYRTASSGVVASIFNPLGNVGEAAGDGFNSIEGLFGSAFGDLLTGDAAGNSLSGEAGNDQIRGLNGNDNLSGAAGNDACDGGDGADVILGGDGNDTLWGDSFGGSGADALSGGEGADVLLGWGGNDTLYGDAGADIIYGMDGADVIKGGAGLDEMFGGVGADTFLFTADGFQADVVYDFTTGSDKLLISTSIFDNLAELVASATQIDNRTVLTTDAGDQIWISFTNGHLAATDIVFF